MKAPKCRTCGIEHRLGPCPSHQSTATRMDVCVPEISVPNSIRLAATLPGSTPGTEMANDVATPAGTQALPVDIKIIGFDKGGDDFGAKVTFRVALDGRLEILSVKPSKATFDKVAYQREYMRKYRAKAKGKT